jgi:oxygen-independent coproporphyrinogen-3 oxidase
MQKSMTGAAVAQCNEVSRSELPFEFMLNALRLREGVPLNAFSERTGMPLSAIEKNLQMAQEKGLLANDYSRIKPTDKGFDFLSDLQSLFLPQTDVSGAG